MKTSQSSLRLLYLVIFFLIFTSVNHAQFYSLKKSPLSFPSFDIKFIHAAQENIFSDAHDQAIYSGMYDLDFSIPVSNAFNINFIFPLSVLKYSNFKSETELGNIVIGIQTKEQGSNNQKFSFSIILFLPSSPPDITNANLSSMLINFNDIIRYINNSIGLYLNTENRWIFSDESIIKLVFGGQILNPEASFGETKFLFHYGIGSAIAIRKISIIAEISGILFLTSNPNSFSDNLYNTFSVGLNYRSHYIKLGIFYKFYFNEMIPFHGALGFNIQFDFP